MRVLFTGATGVLGREAIPELVRTGHSVTAAVRDLSETDWMERLGVEITPVDLFDPVAVRRAAHHHDAVVHFATSIPPQARFTKRSAWTLNDRLRSDATANLVDAALRAEAEVFIQQSVSFVYADGGADWLDEGSRVEPIWDVLDSALVAERHVARFADSGGRGVALRLGRLYGPGRVSGEFLDAVAARKVPIVGAGANFVSYVHVVDVGRAVVAALTAPAGTYNVTDVAPVTVAEDIGIVGDLLGAGEPRRLPYALARSVAGRAARMLTVSQRVSSEFFRTVTGWEPSVPSVRQGWPEIVEQRRAAA
ncbi:MAG TPA: NAD(P)-dependent oxidoreductase [Acidimicrobiia bacterium]|nr:NAD(P)-dependent oxidoreductase [Acidimicrobiia bacterium]